MLEPSDLDLFFITMEEDKSGNGEFFSNLDKYLFFAKLYEINKNLKYKDPSKKGGYWTFISKNNLLEIGSRQEDYNNSFTARMLLILESKPVYNETAYGQLVKEMVDKYFVDYSDHASKFHPLFLMNDILRYWYTLTMNYEYRRDDADNESQKCWKRLKLKYARLVTCFSMLACLYENGISSEYVIDCIKMTPFERLYMLSKKHVNLKKVVENIEKEYKWFLSLKQYKSDWWDSEENKAAAWNNAKKFHDIMMHKLMYFVSKANPDLRNKVDVY